MTVQSLGYRTDLFFSRYEGEVADLGSRLAVRTPSNPTFFWGNYLLFDRPPAAGDYERWRALFAEEIGTPPAVRHIAFGWNGTDGETGEIAPFLAAGFRLEELIVLTARRVHPPLNVNTEVIIRPVRNDWEWDAALQCQIACRDPEHGEEAWRVFVTRKMANYRAMVSAGLGCWFGAFAGDRIAGDLGVFVNDGFGRFQMVGTHPEYRRRGICATLVHYASVYALTHMGARDLVMVADAHYHAARIYESVGFAPHERQVGITWWQKS